MADDKPEKTPRAKFAEALMALHREMHPELWLKGAAAEVQTFIENGSLQDVIAVSLRESGNNSVLEIRDPRYHRDDGATATYIAQPSGTVRFVGERPTTPTKKREEASIKTEAELYPHVFEQIRKALGFEEAANELLILT